MDIPENCLQQFVIYMYVVNDNVMHICFAGILCQNGGWLFSPYSETTSKDAAIAPASGIKCWKSLLAARTVNLQNSNRYPIN